eukprot:1158837-Pelagomonas_calceolata.AAC.6
MSFHDFWLNEVPQIPAAQQPHLLAAPHDVRGQSRARSSTLPNIPLSSSHQQWLDASNLWIGYPKENLLHAMYIRSLREQQPFFQTAFIPRWSNLRPKIRCFLDAPCVGPPQLAALRFEPASWETVLNQPRREP